MARKAESIDNPLFVDGVNELINEDMIPLCLEDTLTGCIRAFGNNPRQTFVALSKLIILYKHLDTFDSESVAGKLRCSKAQANRYMQVIRFSVPFVARWLSTAARVRGYTEITAEQVLCGMLPIYVRQSKGN